MSDEPRPTAEKDAPLTDWEQRKLAIVHDIALALSESEWDALRWHFAQVWDDAYDCCASDGTPQFHNGNPYRDDETGGLEA